MKTIAIQIDEDIARERNKIAPQQRKKADTGYWIALLDARAASYYFFGCVSLKVI